MTITVFSKPVCPQCTATYRAFDSAKVEVKSIDLSADPEALATVKDLGYLQAPVVLVTEQDGTVVDHWSGFKPDLIKNYASLA